MCIGIALARSEVPTELIGRFGLERHAYERGTRREFRFYYRDRRPRLPVLRDGGLVFARWGNGRGQSRFLPRTGWTWLETVRQGGWRGLGGVVVDIPATLGMERGFWFRIREGARGLLVPDERGRAVVYMLCVPSSRYYQVMTGSSRMPLLIGQQF